MNSTFFRKFTYLITHFSSNFSNTQSLHTRINSHTICDNNIPYKYYISFNIYVCQSYNKSYGLGRNHKCKGLNNHIR